MPVKPLPDVIAPGLDILFCGINPSLMSAARGHHFARPGNRFWPALHLAGLTPRRLAPDEDMELLGYGLSSSIYTTSGTNAFRFRERITAGMVSVNNSTSGAEAHLPFGGNGKSGNGSRQSGIWVLDQFTRWQSMNWDYAGKLQKAQMEVAEILGDSGYRLAWD